MVLCKANWLLQTTSKDMETKAQVQLEVEEAFHSEQNTMQGTSKAWRKQTVVGGAPLSAPWALAVDDALLHL